MTEWFASLTVERLTEDGHTIRATATGTIEAPRRNAVFGQLLNQIRLQDPRMERLSDSSRRHDHVVINFYCEPNFGPPQPGTEYVSSRPAGSERL